MRSARMSPATIALLGLAAAFGGAQPAPRAREQREADDIAERQARRAAKLARRAAHSQSMGTVIKPDKVQSAAQSPRQRKKQQKLARRIARNIIEDDPV